MADTVQDLLDAVTQEASFDVTTATALKWINRRWRTMAGRARAYRKTLSIGVTAANVAFYPVTGVLELYELEVGGVPYGKARRPDVYANAQGRLLWEGMGEVGLIVEDADASAVRGLTLIPTPTVAGTAITGFAALEPPDLTNDATGNALLAAVLDGEFVEPLIRGAMAIGYGREGNDRLEAAGEAQFQAGTEEFRRVCRRRFRGPGPTQIRMVGFTA